MRKILTVSIAAYNVEKYIRKTLDSLIIENMDILEVLIIVDGCKDKTLEIAKEYEAKYPNTFKAIYKENGGYGSTINKGIELATGTYFKQLDGDDWYDTDNLNKICEELLKMEEVDVVYTPYIRYIEKDRTEILEKNNIESEIKENILGKALRRTDKPLIMHTLMYRTEILRENNIFIDEHCFYTDTEYAIIPLYYAETIKIFNIPLYIYRIGIEGQSISIEGRIKNYKDHEKVDETLMEQYKRQSAINLDVKDYIENFMMRSCCATITNFLVIINTNKDNYKHIKEFDNKVYQFNKNIYRKMGEYSKIIKLLRKNNYYIYVLCHFIRRFKLKCNTK